MPSGAVSDKKLAIKKSAKIADSLEFRDNPINSALTSKTIIADQNILSRGSKVNQAGGGSAGNRTPETLMSKQSSDHPGPAADLLYQKESVLSLNCPYCYSTDFVKRGTRLKKSGKTQLYLCRACKRTFTPAWFKGRQHSWQVILDAMSYYNLGFSLEQVCKIMNQKNSPLNSP